MMVKNRRGRRSRAPARQTVTVVAEANSATELQQLQPAVTEIPEGVRGRVEIEGPFIGPLADLFLAEQIFGSHLTPAGAKLIDVFGDGLNKAVVEWEVPRGAPASRGTARAGLIITAIVLILAIAGALFALGWAVRQIKVLFFGKGDAAGGVSRAAFFGIAGVGALLVGSTFFNRGRQ